jgi:D-beta-D-heptose 7-phosphate kinase/D-beta-D-heptose 1-phosphate adenosyltransferase
VLANPKLFSLGDAVAIRNRRWDRAIVLTNGCFDLLHAGHIFSLQQAAQFGELWVALNGDGSIRRLKGTSRPFIGERERAYMLSALECVSGIFIFTDQHLANELAIFHPDIYVKSSDYTVETLNAEERTEIKFVKTLSGFSTTSLVKKSKIHIALDFPCACC